MCIFGHFRPNIGIFGSFRPTPAARPKNNANKVLCVFVLYVGTKTLVVARGLYLARHLFNLYYLNFKGKNVNISDRFDESEILFRFANRCRSDN